MTMTMTHSEKSHIGQEQIVNLTVPQMFNIAKANPLVPHECVLEHIEEQSVDVPVPLTLSVVMPIQLVPPQPRTKRRADSRCATDAKRRNGQPVCASGAQP